MYFFTAVGLLPRGSGYFTCIPNMKLVTTKQYISTVIYCYVLTIYNILYTFVNSYPTNVENRVSS